MSNLTKSHIISHNNGRSSVFTVIIFGINHDRVIIAYSQLCEFICPWIFFLVQFAQVGRAFFFKLRKWNENKRHAFASNCFQRLAEASSTPFVFHASVIENLEFAEFMEFALCAVLQPLRLDLLRFILINQHVKKSATIRK